MKEVEGGGERGTHEHGRDAGSASDHADVLGERGRVAHLALGALDVDVVADLELAKVLRDVARRVALRARERRGSGGAHDGVDEGTVERTLMRRSKKPTSSSLEVGV